MKLPYRQSDCLAIWPRHVVAPVKNLQAMVSLQPMTSTNPPTQKVSYAKHMLYTAAISTYLAQLN